MGTSNNAKFASLAAAIAATTLFANISYAQDTLSPQEFLDGYEHCNNTNTSPTVFTNCLNKLMAKKNGTEFTPTAQTKTKTPSNSTVVSKCRSEWGTDFEMQEYCQKNQYEALSKWNVVKDSEDGLLRGIVNKCTVDWPDDFVMKYDCYEKQGTGLKQMATYFDSDNTQHKTIATECVAKWDSDWVMSEYCTSNQIGAYNRLNGG